MITTWRTVIMMMMMRKKTKHQKHPKRPNTHQDSHVTIARLVKRRYIENIRNVIVLIHLITFSGHCTMFQDYLSSKFFVFVIVLFCSVVFFFDWFCRIASGSSVKTVLQTFINKPVPTCSAKVVRAVR